MTTPAVILVAPQLPENVGSAARVMANFGLKDLRLVTPRFASWPNARAQALAVGAFDGPDGVQVKLFDDVRAALSDRTYVLAATARHREIDKPVHLPRDALAACLASIAAGGAPAVMFGSEQSGLDNDAVALADAIVTYPVNPGFWSLNLAQAVAVFSYEWGAAAGPGLPERFRSAPAEGVEGPATREELMGLIAHFEEELDASGFFWPPIKAELMKQNLRSTLTRQVLTSQEVSTLRGAIKSIAQGPRRRVRELRAREADAERARKGVDSGSDSSG